MISFEQYKQQNNKREILICLNKHPEKKFKYFYFKKINIQNLKKAIEKQFGVKSQKIRFFNQEGVQLNSQDIQYFNSQQKIFISKGQQFDANSCYDEYEIKKQLGEGGFGKVYLGKHRQSQQLIAIKIIKSNKICKYIFQQAVANYVDIIFRQPQILKTLHHPNIVKIHKCFTLKSMEIIVIMEYMEGGDLKHYLKKNRPLSEEIVKIFFKQIIKAISYCHHNNLVHRDLKLENILLKNTNQKIIKIADFGISGVKNYYNPQIQLGTLRYMAPQILNKKLKGNNFCIDIWACGCILYYLIFGQHPFKYQSKAQTIENIKTGTYIIPKSIKVSSELISCIQRFDILIENVNVKNLIKDKNR